MLDKLKYNEDCIDKIKYLNNSDKPILIYGAGEMAEMVVQKLNKKVIKGHIVPSDFYVDNTYLNGIKIYDIGEFNGDFDNYNIIITCYGHPLRQNILSMLDLNNVFMLFHVYDLEKITCDDIKQCQNLFEETYNLLEDDLSKNILVNYLNAHISNDAVEILTTFSDDIYFNSITVDENKDEIFIDAGAYDGDSLRKFIVLSQII